MIPLSCPLPLAVVSGVRRRVAECASCGQVRPLIRRGLCNTCRSRHFEDGTIAEFGYVKADRLEDYAWMRRAGESIPVAAARLGVSERTAWRYEAALRESGEMSWRSWAGREEAA